MVIRRRISRILQLDCDRNTTGRLPLGYRHKPKHEVLRVLCLYLFLYLFIFISLSNHQTPSSPPSICADFMMRSRAIENSAPLSCHVMIIARTITNGSTYLSRHLRANDYSLRRAKSARRMCPQHVRV